MNLAAITFLYPAMLAGLLVLPIVWLIIRSAPRAPKQIVFPAARLLRGLRANRRDMQRAPIWQTILRCLILTMLILAASRPVLNRTEFSQNEGALLVIADNSWSSAANWTEYRTGLRQIINQARLDLRSIYIAQTAPEASGATTTRLPDIIGPVSPHEAERFIDRLHPRPWAPDYAVLSNQIADHQYMANSIGSILWLTDNMEQSGKADLANDLATIAPITVLEPNRDNRIAVQSLIRNRTGLGITLTHQNIDAPHEIVLLARNERGRVLLRHKVKIAPATNRTEAEIPLPSDITNSIQSVGIEGIESAATIFQTGARWQQRKVGVIVSSGDSPVLLSDRYFFLDRAISPYADVTYAPLGKLLEGGMDILVVAGPISGLGSQYNALERWLRDGGMLVRFAGDSTTEVEPEFLPVTLRLGNRDFGGSMSWEKPKRLLAFPETSPFSGITIPEEITVNRQLLAEPDPDIVAKTWARLTDGTPLVTSATRNAGRIVLFHVTPWADWSSLPMSGLFVEIWQRLLPLASPSDRSDAELQTSLPPQSILDGFGRAHQPDATILPLRMPLPVPGPRHPPGIYGENGQAVAFNLGSSLENLDHQIRWPSDVTIRQITNQDQIDLAAMCLMMAMLLLIFDGVALILVHHVSLRRSRRSDALTSVLMIAFIGTAMTVGTSNSAQAVETQAPALQPRLAYLKTDVAPIDRLSQSGLAGLTEILRRRSAADLAPADAIDPEADDLSFYPLIYWPLVDGQQPFSEFAQTRINRYLDSGGMILIDSRDQEVEPARLRRLLAGLEIPILDKAPGDHILFRSFYLLDHAYGRFAAPLWLDARPDQRLDGVASVLFGGNDWASAWMLEEGRTPENRTDDISPRQREMAWRFGVNLVMYALTGSYKGDQVHLPAILERLGR